MLNPAFALVSMISAPNSLVFVSPSSTETCLQNSPIQIRVTMEQVSDSDAEKKCLIRGGKSRERKKESQCIVSGWFQLLPLVYKVCLVTDKHYDNILSSLSANLIYPASSIKKRLPVCTRNMRKN